MIVNSSQEALRMPTQTPSFSIAAQFRSQNFEIKIILLPRLLDILNVSSETSMPYLQTTNLVGDCAVRAQCYQTFFTAIIYEFL